MVLQKRVVLLYYEIEYQENCHQMDASGMEERGQESRSRMEWLLQSIEPLL